MKIKENHTLTIDKFIFNNAILLAPMEGYTDIPFRIMCKRMGVDLVYSEFIAAEALVRDSAKSILKMKIIEEERPAAVQIFGNNVQSMVESAKIVEQSGVEILDINFGCWARKVVLHNSGAAFLKNLDAMQNMAMSIVNAVSIPVTAKTRLGWDWDSIVIEQAASMLEAVGIKALTVHCRTRNMGYQGEADWSWIPKIKQCTSIPIILNGDVRTPHDVVDAFNNYNCDAVMIGRAAVGNPFLFRDIKHYINNDSIAFDASINERIDLCLEHLRLCIEYKDFPRGLFEFRKHYSGYLKGLWGASKVRQELVITNTYQEIEDKLNKYKDFLSNYNNNQLDENTNMNYDNYFDRKNNLSIDSNKNNTIQIDE